MKILKRLEKSKSFWFLLGISFLFFLLRLPSLIEPNWYGDEGIYQIIGKAMGSGRILYSQIWDNKPPLLYITYALFNGEQFQVRIFSLISSELMPNILLTLSITSARPASSGKSTGTLTKLKLAVLRASCCPLRSAI